MTEIGSPTYASTGPAVGKRNGSSKTSTLSIGLSTTTSRSTTKSGAGGITLELGITKIEGHGDYSVTKSTTTGQTITDTLSVPGGYYGYAQPKVEYRKFLVEQVKSLPKCNEQVLDSITINAITTAPFFSECTAKAACTPKP